MDIDLLTLADDAYVDDGGRLSIIGIVDNVYAPSYPMTIVETALVLRINSEPNDYGREFVVTIQLADPDGALLLDIETAQQVPSPHQQGESVKNAIVAKIDRIDFAQPGWYQLSVFIDGELARELSLPAFVSV